MVTCFTPGVWLRIDSILRQMHPFAGKKLLWAIAVYIEKSLILVGQKTSWNSFCEKERPAAKCQQHDQSDAAAANKRAATRTYASVARPKKSIEPPKNFTN